MRRNLFRCGMLCMLASSMMLTSCLQEEDIVEKVEEKYNKSWVETFGAIDPEHDFNTAMGVTANFNLSGLPEDSYTVKIYTANPINKDSRVLAKKRISNIDAIKFDVEKIQNNVFVTILGKQGLVVNGYYNINNNEIKVQTSVGARSGEAPSLGSEHEYIANCHYINTLLEPVGENEYWYVEDFKTILGEGGPFQETIDNITKWGNSFKTDVYYTMGQGGGPVTLTLNYINTGNDNQIGYFYWKGDISNAINAKKYILAPTSQKDKKLHEYIYTQTPNSWYEDEIYSWNDKIALYSSQNNISGAHDKAKFWGCKFHLVHFDENGNASYNFEEGTNIAFFLAYNTKAQNASSVFYSIIEMNKKTDHGNGYHTGCENNYPHAVTFKYNSDSHSTMFLGFEDHTDHDMNDMVFFANGNFSNQVLEMDNKEASDNSWIIACEDLGTTGDYDFNDVVFKVTHVAGEENATLTPLAAGGTLPIEVYFDDNKIGDAEFHTLFSGVSDHKQPINAHAFDKSCPQTYQINVGTDFTITNLESLNRFKVKVEGNNGISNFIEMGNREGSTTAPQMIVLPDTWKWPKESVLIHNAYVKFGDWNKVQTKNMDWYKYNDSKQVVNWTPSATE